jgi:radical SAM protein with 4Fe4S-binding SPASM domain
MEGKEFYGENMPQLKRIQIELTTRCNEYCVHCYIPQENRLKDLDFKYFTPILEQCKSMGVELITLSGGEVFLYPHILEVMEIVNAYDFDLCVLSNLTVLNETILAKLKKIKSVEVQTSLYSVCSEIHDSVTRKTGSCELTKQAILQLRNNNIPVCVRYVETKLNKNSYPAIIDFSRQIGASPGPDNMIIAQTDLKKLNTEYRLNVDEAMQVIDDILNNDNAYTEERFLPDYKTLDTLPLCVQNVCAESLSINAEGHVTPAPAWNYVLGNIYEQELSDIWENAPKINYLRNISTQNFPKCQTCPDIQFCNMSLEGNANENPNGDPFIIPSHICELAKETRIFVHNWHKKNA